MTIRNPTQPADKEIHHPLDNKRQNQDEDKLGQLVLRKVDQIVVPSALNGFETFFIRNVLEK
ncbi:hypothetical protein [Granulicella arctica]|uniref:Uncharacterized protein n=1 Tax=Granulicella arctica TaxID=940613 RepID=A0A7Y9PJT7_9BACT|nr:hypothetical protein [Granulicella arctica]NYF80373.1 hypothetical protein [Granulicella arctica]